MGRRELIAGRNFSGRSALLRAHLQPETRGASFFIGPYAEAALSGLSSSVADEIAIYASPSADRRPLFAPLDIETYGRRKPQTLSGGEQVLLALHCFSRSALTSLAIDTALEQLDSAHRMAALAFVDAAGETGDVTLIDNRMTVPPPGWTGTSATAENAGFACDLAQLTAALAPRAAPVIAIRGIDFRYRKGAEVFRNVDVSLQPGRAYRLFGPNGAGKTTLLKILVGVLIPSSGKIRLDDIDYAPWRHGNAAFALAMQNPDHQWCGATLREDLARRRIGLKRHRLAVPSDERFAHDAKMLGIASLDQHLYELPLAARKRVSWLWPLSGVMPWLMLDEPTVGQDGDTQGKLAAALAQVCALGYGVVFVTHDDDFAALVPHRRLSVEDRTIRLAD
jgi:energy-coupling factor transport system ATP-binding protein